MTRRTWTGEELASGMKGGGFFEGWKGGGGLFLQMYALVTWF